MILQTSLLHRTSVTKAIRSAARIFFFSILKTISSVYPLQHLAYALSWCFPIARGPNSVLYVLIE